MNELRKALSVEQVDAIYESELASLRKRLEAAERERDELKRQLAEIEYDPGVGGAYKPVQPYHHAWHHAMEKQDSIDLRGKLEAVTEDARMQGDAIAGIFSALLDPDRPASDLSEREKAAADIAASALAALQSYCPHEARLERARAVLQKQMDSSGHSWACADGLGGTECHLEHEVTDAPCDACTPECNSARAVLDEARKMGVL